MAEKYRKNIYCQKAFLKQYLSRLEENTFNRDTDDVYGQWNIIKSLLLCSDVKLYLDFTNEEFENQIQDIEKKRKLAAREGDFFKMDQLEQFLWDLNLRQNTSEIHLKFQDNFSNFEEFTPADSEQYDGIYFVEAEDDLCKSKSEDYGILVLNTNSYEELITLSKDNSFAISKNAEHSWDILLDKAQSPCNVLIIIDNFVLSDTKLYKDNIYKILKVLVPKKLSDKVTFQILIVTKMGNFNIDDRYNNIDKIIKELKPQLQYRLSILNNSGVQFHDRTIITNNRYISCGGGFDLFKNGKSQKTTTINFYGLYINENARWVSDAYSNVVHDIYKVLDVINNKPDTTTDKLIGEYNNRIIENCK